MQVGLLGPRILGPDRADAVPVFFQDRLAETVAGHALIAIGLVLFTRLLRRWHGVLVTDETPRPLAVAFVASGTAATALTALLFALTLTAAVRGSLGGDPDTVTTLYHAAGFIFHSLLSAALASFLAACVLLVGRTRGHPAWSRSAGWALVLLLGLEAFGGPLAFLVAQTLFLSWMVIVSTKVVDRAAPAAG